MCLLVLRFVIKQKEKSQKKAKKKEAGECTCQIQETLLSQVSGFKLLRRALRHSALKIQQRVLMRVSFLFFSFFENTYNAAWLHESQVCAGNYCCICANMWLTLNMLRPIKALCDCRCISTCFNGQQMSDMNDEQLAAPDTRLITLSSLPLFHRVCLFWLFFFCITS